MLSLRLDPETESRLAALASLTGRTKTFYLRELVEENLDDLEDRYLAEARLEQRYTPITSSQMRKDLGLDN